MRVITDTAEVWKVLRERGEELRKGAEGIVEVPLGDDWVVLAVVGWTEGRQPYTVRGALVVPRGEVPPGGLHATTLRQPCGISDAPAAFLAEGMRASLAGMGASEEQALWWQDETVKAHQRAYRRKGPAPGGEVTEQHLADFAVAYLGEARRDRRGIYARMAKAYKHTYSETYLRDRINDATEAGLLPKRQRGKVTTEGTEKLARLLDERKKR